MPDAGKFRGAIVRAVRAGLGLVSEHRASVVVASPPDAERDTPGGAPFAE